MRRFAHSIRRHCILGVAAIVTAQLLAAPARAAEPVDWRAEVAKIPGATYTRDARASIAEAGTRLQPHLIDDLGRSRLAPVLADLDTRYFDGARFKDTAGAAAAYDNLEHLESYLKGRVSGGSKPSGDALVAHVDALVLSLTGVRLLADASIQDAEATIGPFRATPPPAPAPAGLAESFGDLSAARDSFAKADDMLRKGNPEPAAVHSAAAQRSAFNVLTRLGVTYAGDHDADGVTDVVELRFGASPLLVDSDGDGLTDAFEIYQLSGWTKANTADSDGDGTPDGAEDVDSDGLTNLREQELGTSPTESDTDHDGVSDGIEVGRGTNPLVADPRQTPPLGGGAPPIVPAPNLQDTDGDGLIDAAEAEEETDPANVDTDGDGLSDGAEVNEWSINPLNPDSDGDSLRDDYESVHVEDQGLDPGRPDEQISKWTYVTDFLLGMFAGDFAPRDSMAWLAGNLCSGGLSAIPVVGWILGGLADLRDTIAGLIHGDWVSAGLSILGVVPYVGDAIAIPGKAARFVLRFTHRIDAVLRFVARYDKIPDFVKETAFQLILGADWDALVGDTAGFSVAASRFSKAGLTRLARGDRTDIRRIARAMYDPNHVPGPRVPFQYSGPRAEDYLHDTLLTGTRHRQFEIDTTGYPTPRSRSRKADVAVEDPPGEFTLHEVKAGVSNYGSEVTQCQKDAWMLTPAGRAVHGKNIRAVHWHFMPHGAYNSLGPSEDLLKCLIDNKIPFTIHTPDV